MGLLSIKWLEQCPMLAFMIITNFSLPFKKKSKRAIVCFNPHFNGLNKYSSLPLCTFIPTPIPGKAGFFNLLPVVKNITKVKLKFLVFRSRSSSLTQRKADLSNEQYTQVSSYNVVGYI